jgi:polar amino acid transport system substrate-binding protein
MKRFGLAGRLGAAAVGALAALGLFVGMSSDAVQASAKMDALKKAGTINLGWAAFKPLIFLDTSTGKVSGFWGDITEQMVRDGLHLQPKWVEGTWATIVTGIQTDKWDVAPAGITDARSGIADATDPFAKVDFTMLLKAGSPAKTWKDLDQPGKRISVSEGSNTDQALTKNIQKATIVRVRQEQALLELLGDKVDAQAVQRDYAMQAIHQYQGLRVMSDAFGYSLVGWYVPKGADDLKSAVNEWLAGAKKRGVVKQLLEKWKLEGAEPA